MEKLKPTNISSFYAPTGNSMKIADFEISKKTVRTANITVPNPIASEFNKSKKNDNTWLYILTAAAIIIGGLCYMNYNNRKDDEDV